MGRMKKWPVVKFRGQGTGRTPECPAQLVVFSLNNQSTRKRRVEEWQVEVGQEERDPSSLVGPQEASTCHYYRTKKIRGAGYAYAAHVNT